MVTLHNRRGGGMLGCLFPLALLGVGFFLAVLFGRPWFKYQEYKDDFKSAARFAQTLSDSVILARLQMQADSLGLPPQAKRIIIRRLSNPDRILIQAQYEVTVKVPLLGPRVLKFRPSVEEETL